MSEYKNLLNPLLEDIEGNVPDVYQDSKGVPSAGIGFNLDDKETQGIMKLHGVDPEEIRSQKRSLASDETAAIKDSILNRKEELVKSRMGSDLFDLLPDNKKAALMSMGYQSLNNLGPNLRQHISEGDEIGALREMILNTNADEDPGILKRRLREAELYGGPVDFSGAFKTMSPEEKKKLNSIIEKVQNEHTKKELIDRYGSYLGSKPEPVQLLRLGNILGK